MDLRQFEKSVQVIPYLEGLDQKKEKGHGAFGAVYEVKLNGLPCIAKGLHDIFVNNQVADMDRQAVRKNFLHECRLLSELKHPNIVQFLGIYHSKDDVYLVMEYMHMALDVCLKEYPNIPLPFKSSIVQDVSYGLLHLHSSNPPIIHRDLTAANVLLTEGMRAKIADLGVSKMFDIQWLHRWSGQTIQPGTPAYMPPEALTQTPSYDFKLDIFSFGVLMLYTATQEFPVVYELSAEDITIDVLKNHTMQILKRKRWIDQMGEEHPFRSIVIQCLQDRPESRPTAKVLSENMSSIYCKNKEEWKNILELHSQLQTSKSELQESTVMLQNQIIELQQRNLELQKCNADLEHTIKSITDLYHVENEQKEKQHLLELQNQNIAFRAKEKQLEDEIHSWIKTSDLMKNVKSEEVGGCPESPGPVKAQQQSESATSDLEAAQALVLKLQREVESLKKEREEEKKLNQVQPRQRSFTTTDPTSLSHCSSGKQPSAQPDTVPSVAPALKQEPALSVQQRKVSESLLDPPLQLSSEGPNGIIPPSHPTSVIDTPQLLPKPPLSTLSEELNYIFSKSPLQLEQNAITVMPKSQQDNYQQTKLILPQNGGQSGNSISLPHQDSIINIPKNMDIQPLSPMSGERLQTIATNHFQPKSKTTGAVEDIILPLEHKQEDKQMVQLDDSHARTPVPKPRPRATKPSQRETQLNQSDKTQLQSHQSEMCLSARILVPADGHDPSKCKQQMHFSTESGEPPSLAQSSEGKSGSVLPRHANHISEEPSPAFSMSQSQPVNRSTGGVAVITLPSDLNEHKQDGKQIDKCNDIHETKPVPKRIPQRLTSLYYEAFSAMPMPRQRSYSALPQHVQPEIGPSVVNSVLPEEQDSSKCGQQPPLAQSSEGHSGEHSSTISANHSQSRRKPIGGVAVFPFLLHQMGREKENRQIDTPEMAGKITNSRQPPPVSRKPIARQTSEPHF